MDVEKYLAGFFKGTKNPTLKAMKYFMDEFGHPEKNLKIVHVAGTNGKGSCVEMMAKVLINSGYKVGKFMSPHLIKYNERISVQNQNISDQEMEDLIVRIKPKIDYYNSVNEGKVTLFELETTMALLYFKEKNCDFVVLETGLGGTYDCTNIVNPLISVIASIGYDHMNILGDSLIEIAENKAGIIKENSETVFSLSDDEEVNKLIEKTCKEKNNKLHLIKQEDIKNYSFNNEFQKFDYKNYKDIVINLKGEKQLSNTAIIIECVEILREKGYEISDEALREALITVVHKARLETICKKPLMIFDGAHNKPAIENFVRSIDMYYKNDKKVYIISILKTKDYKTVLTNLLKDKTSEFIFTDGNDKNIYVEKEELLRTAEEILAFQKDEKIGNNEGLPKLYPKDLEEAIDFVKENCQDKVIFFVGSFYIYGTVMEKLND